MMVKKFVFDTTAVGAGSVVGQGIITRLAPSGSKIPLTTGKAFQLANVAQLTKGVGLIDKAFKMFK